MAKPKTARAIEANAGIRNRFSKDLQALEKSFSKEVATEILFHLADEGLLLAQDVSLSNPTSSLERRKLRDLYKKVLADWERNPDAVRMRIEEFVSRNIGRWVMRITPRAQKLANWLARSIAADVTSSQRKAYEAAGLSSDFLAEKWKVPVVRQRIGRSAANALPASIEWSTNLITKMAARDVQRLQDVIVGSLSTGKNVNSIQSLLETMSGFDADRAKRVAIDQTNKITNTILRANDEDLGVTEGIWIHVPGQFSSRQSHVAMNGKKFDLKKGMYDPSVGKHIQCGELPFCRCIYRPALNFTQLIQKKS